MKWNAGNRGRVAVHLPSLTFSPLHVRTGFRKGLLGNLYYNKWSNFFINAIDLWFLCQHEPLIPAALTHARPPDQQRSSRRIPDDPRTIGFVVILSQSWPPDHIQQRKTELVDLHCRSRSEEMLYWSRSMMGCSGFPCLYQMPWKNKDYDSKTWTVDCQGP